jgi:hypothetical protein
MQILGITTDSAANNGTCMTELERLTDGQWQKSQWVRCVAHIVNLSVQAFLKEIRATVQDYRLYLKSTVSCKLDSSIDEETAFLKVMIINLFIASTYCSQNSIFRSQTCNL